jgi:hypothetical protein
VAAGRADAGSVYVQSATSGEVTAGRLTLHGVGHNVTWSTSNGATGVTPITLAHERLFVDNRSANGVLDIRDQRHGTRLAFRLSDMRYSADRDTVSYRAERLTAHAGAATAAAAAVPRRFGAASLLVSGVPDSSPGEGATQIAPQPLYSKRFTLGNDLGWATMKLGEAYGDNEGLPEIGSTMRPNESQYFEVQYKAFGTGIVFATYDILNQSGQWVGSVQVQMSYGCWGETSTTIVRSQNVSVQIGGRHDRPGVTWE